MASSDREQPPPAIQRVAREALSRESAAERWTVGGVVQGVGFRPFVHQTAQRLGLTGWVQNTAAGVTIEVVGPPAALDLLEAALRTQAPPLARVDVLTRNPCVRQPHDAFEIRASAGGRARAGVAIDSATCDDCLRELRDPNDRRYRHPLVNCTNCGPRFTLIRRIPYDRANTTMASFAMCAACAAEYADASDRRYHAQPICCPQCGPQVRLVDSVGRILSDAPLRDAARRLVGGEILAIKGLGGFHLAVRADDEAAVQRLRERKGREAKPLAVMVRDVEAARALVQVSAHAERVLSSAMRPILLLPRIATACIAPSVAPRSSRFGVMLAYTPIHALLFEDPEFATPPLVMTSANFSNEPLVTANEDACARLASVCDALLLHDRDIERPVDDSVLLSVYGEPPLVIRRARGAVPATIPLSPAFVDAPPGLAMGGDLKSTVAVVRGGEVIVSQHLGDLSHARTFDAYTKAIDDMLGLFETQPAWIAHDMHPDYFSTRYALRLAKTRGCPLIGVQHHHAHAAALLTEHCCDEPIVALVCDGTGLGTDGVIWGGELLLCDTARFQRLVRLRPIPLAGGDAAAMDVRRTALAVVLDAFGNEAGERLPTGAKLSVAESSLLVRMIVSGVNAPLSSGVGRLFDAVACLLGLAVANTYEGQAAQALEACANEAPGTAGAAAPAVLLQPVADAEGLCELDWRPLVRWIVERRDAGDATAHLAAGFHGALARGLADAASSAAREAGVSRVGLSGGVFCNLRLTQAVTERLRAHELDVLRHRLVPPNDGGLSLGQAAVAVRRVVAGVLTSSAHRSHHGGTPGAS